MPALLTRPRPSAHPPPPSPPPLPLRQVANGKFERQPPLCIRWDGVNLTRALTPVVWGTDWRFPESGEPDCVGTNLPKDEVSEKREQRKGRMYDWKVDSSGSIVKVLSCIGLRIEIIQCNSCPC